MGFTRRPVNPEIYTLLSSLVDGVFDFGLEGPEGQMSRGHIPLEAGGRAGPVPVTTSCAVACLAD